MAIARARRPHAFSVESMSISVPILHVAGAGARLARGALQELHHEPLSLREDALASLPTLASGQILVFADPPSVEGTRRAFEALLARIPVDAPVRLVLVSSISAGFGDSALFAHEGRYAARKRLAETLVKSRCDLDVVVLRVGNVFEHGGWQAVAHACPRALLPTPARRCAVTTYAALRRSLDAVLARPLEPGACAQLDIFDSVPVERIFSRARHVPGLMAVYRQPLGRVAVKLAARLARGRGLYLPSPDDLNSLMY